MKLKLNTRVGFNKYSRQLYIFFLAIIKLVNVTYIASNDRR